MWVFCICIARGWAGGSDIVCVMNRGCIPGSPKPIIWLRLTGGDWAKPFHLRVGQVTGHL